MPESSWNDAGAAFHSWAHRQHVVMGCSYLVSLSLVFFGVLLLLETTGVADELVSRYWPVVLILLGLVSLYNMRRYRVRFKRFRNRFPPDEGL